MRNIVLDDLRDFIESHGFEITRYAGPSHSFVVTLGPSRNVSVAITKNKVILNPTYYPQREISLVNPQYREKILSLIREWATFFDKEVFEKDE